MISFSDLLFGIFSVLFVAFGPGFLIYRYYLSDRKVFWPLVFGLSLLSIFYVSFLTSLIGAYNFYFVIGFVLLILFGVLVLNKFKDIKFDWERGDIFIVLLFILLSWPRILFSFFFPFTVGDAWASWNRWAVEWFRLSQFSFINDFTYPQLLPINLSFIYKLFNQLYVSEYFSHGFTVLFSFFVLLILYRWRFSLSSLTVFGFGLYFLANQSSFFSVSIGDGLADIPVAFFIILSLYLWQEYIHKGDRRYLYLTFIMAAGATLTKQAGLFYFTLLPVMYLVYEVYVSKARLKESFKKMVRPWLVSLVLIIPWYGIQQFSQVATFDQIQDALEGRSLTERVLTSLYIVVQNFGIYLSTTYQSSLFIFGVVFSFGLVFLFGLYVALRNSYFYNVLWWIYILPYLILWALVYSYDARNAYVGLILAFFISFDGILFFVEKYKKHFEWLYKRWIFVLLVIVLFLSTFIQKPLYDHIRNPMDFSILFDPFISKVGEVSVSDRELVDRLFEELDEGGVLLTNDQPLVAKLHLEPRSYMVSDEWLFGGFESHLEDVLGENESILLLWMGEGLELNSLTEYIENVIGNRKVEVLYYKEGRYLYKVSPL